MEEEKGQLSEKELRVSWELACEVCNSIGMIPPDFKEWLELNNEVNNIINENENELKLGDDAEDTVTGYAGVVTCIAQYLDEPSRVLIENKTAERWFDINRVKGI